VGTKMRDGRVLKKRLTVVAGLQEEMFVARPTARTTQRRFWIASRSIDFESIFQKPWGARH